MSNTPLNPLSRGDLKVSLRDGFLNGSLIESGMTKRRTGWGRCPARWRWRMMNVMLNGSGDRTIGFPPARE